jgi:hypothetical protein
MRAFALVLAVIATPALADEAPQATAPPATASPASPSVGDQIAEFLRTSPAAAIDDVDVSGVTARDDRRVHGEVGVGVGTGGYRSIYMRSDMPIGESAHLGIAFEDTRYGGGYGHVYGAAPAYRLGAEPVYGAFREPQRCGLEGMTPPRPLDVIGGPNGRCAGRPGP